MTPQDMSSRANFIIGLLEAISEEVSGLADACGYTSIKDQNDEFWDKTRQDLANASAYIDLASDQLDRILKNAAGLQVKP